VLGLWVRFPLPVSPPEWIFDYQWWGGYEFCGDIYVGNRVYVVHAEFPRSSQLGVEGGEVGNICMDSTPTARFTAISCFLLPCPTIGNHSTGNLILAKGSSCMTSGK
jgi:hypothetical protein